MDVQSLTYRSHCGTPRNSYTVNNGACSLRSAFAASHLCCANDFLLFVDSATTGTDRCLLQQPSHKLQQCQRIREISIRHFAYRNMASCNTMTSPEPIAVPADHHDPNHSHHPRDLEHQSPTRRSFLSKKGILIAGGILTTTLFLVVGAVWGVTLTRKNDGDDAKAPEVTVATKTSTSASMEFQTVYKDAATFVYSTTRVPLLVAPSLATSTIVFTPTARAAVTSEVLLHPVSTDSVSAMTLEAPTPSDAPSSDTSSKSCLFDGAWVLKEHCEKHCEAWDGHERHCEVSKRSQWVCVSCRM